MTAELAHASLSETPPNFETYCAEFEADLRTLQRTDRMKAFARAVFELNEISGSSHVSQVIRARSRRDADQAVRWAREVYDRKNEFSRISLGAELDRGIGIIINRAISRKREMAEVAQKSWDKLMRMMMREDA